MTRSRFFNKFMRYGFIVLVLLTLGIGTPVEAYPIQIRIDALAAPNSTKHLVAAYLTKLLKERSHGRIKADIVRHEGNTSGIDETVSALTAGKIQMAIPAIDSFCRITEEIKIYEIPFLYRNREHLHRVIDDRVGEGLINKTAYPAFEQLGVWEKGTNHIVMKTAPGDSGGLPEKMIAGRLQPGPATLFRSLSSCAPVAVRTRQPFFWREATLPEALTLIDDLDITDIILSGHSVSGCVLIADKAFWSTLPDDIRIIIAEAIKDATLYARELAQQKDDEALARILSRSGVKVHCWNRQTQQQWRTAMLHQYGSSNNYAAGEKDLIDRVAHYHRVN